MLESKQEKKIIRARVQMMLDEPFWGHIACQLELIRNDKMNPPTMGTDGYHLYYHPDFVDKCSDQEMAGVIAHEVGHLVLMHLTRRQNRVPQLWNIAADLAVNDLILKEEDRNGQKVFALPEGILHNPNFADKAAEWIYNKLPEPDPDNTVEVTLDSHESWEGQGKSDGGQNDKGSGGDSGSQQQNGGGTDTQPQATDGLEQRIQEMVAQSATQARMKGNLPGHLQELVEGVLQPKLNWKTILQDTIVSTAKTDFAMSPPNKKQLYRGFYLPSITGTEIIIACYLDDSGSISSDELRDFVAEVKGICDQYDEYTIYLRTNDTDIRQKWEIHPMDKLPTKFEGRGGTDFRAALKEAESLPEVTCAIFMTDGEGTYPDKEPHIPVIWISTTDYQYPWGTVIRLPERSKR